MSHPATDVAIVGGGVIGCAIAWELARRGVSVAVVERDSPGRGATWAAGGMLSPIAEATGPGPFLDLALASLNRYPAFVDAVVEASGVPVEYRAAGKLLVALDGAQATELEAAYRWQEDAGYAVDWLEPEAVHALEPALTGEVRTGLLVADDRWVDNRALVRALWTAAARAGARFLIGEHVGGIERREVAAGSGAPSGVAGLTLAGGARLHAGRVVVAAGCWSGEIAGLPRPLPIGPVRGQMVAVRTVPPAFSRVVHAGECYLIPHGDGRLVIGATMERVGFRPHATPAGIAGLLAAAVRAAPSLKEAPLEAFWAGLRPGSPDGLPILGPDPEIDGLYYATGHFRNGILLAPVTASLLAASIMGDKPSLPLADFAADRFTPESAR